jgi:hypothetical protein
VCLLTHQFQPEKRHAMKEEIYKDIHQLQVKVQLLEEREKMVKK